MRITDQLGRTFSLDKRPQRIISLVPSLTELLFYFGFEEEVVGVTKFCVHPVSWHKSKPRIGGTKQMHIEQIKFLKPDFILANKEENTKEMIQALEKICAVYVTDINTVEESYDAFIRLGTILDKSLLAAQLVEQCQDYFSDFQNSMMFSKFNNKNYLYFIWLNPDMVAGKQTFIDDVFTKLGMKNACSTIRYPEINHENRDIDFVFLSSEPYPFKEKNIPYFREKYPHSKIILVDGEIFSWYGSRMLQITDYWEQLVNHNFSHF